MEYYRRQSPDQAPPENPEATTYAAVDQASRLRRLLPFPSLADASSLQLPLMQGRRNLIPQTIVPGEIPAAAGQQAATIVSEAASILDEEMARGVLAARDANQFPHSRDADQSGAVLRQVHEVIDNIAQIWPNLLGASTPWTGSSMAAASRVPSEPLPELKPASSLRAGQRARISMMLCNKENRPVRLTPMSTDLIGSTGGRISSQLLEFAPLEIRLEPGEQRELQIGIPVPPDASVGCYAGLLVVIGVDYLRALMTIDVR